MKNIFWIVSGFILAAVLLTRTCTPPKIVVKEVITQVSDTIYLKPDTIYNEIIVTEYKTVTKTREVPVPIVREDTSVYEYATVNVFGDTIAVLDTITIVANRIVEHKQRVILMDVQTTKEVIVELPVVIRDTITVEKEITKTTSFPSAPTSFVGLSYIQTGYETSFVPNVGRSFGRHYVGIGGLITRGKGLEGGLFEYKFRLGK
jgi:hypothetical protein